MKLPIYIDLFNHLSVRLTSPWMLPEGIIRAATRDVYGDPSRVSEPTLRRYADFFYADGARQAIGLMVPKFRFDDVERAGRHPRANTHLVGPARPVDPARACR